MLRDRNGRLGGSGRVPGLPGPTALGRRRPRPGVRDARGRRTRRPTARRAGGARATCRSPRATWLGSTAICSCALDHLRRAEHFAAHETVASQLRAMVASSRGYLEAARGDVDEARRWHRAAVDYSISPVDAPVIAQVLVGLAEISLLDGEAGIRGRHPRRQRRRPRDGGPVPDGRSAGHLGRADGTGRRALRRGVRAGSRRPRRSRSARSSGSTCRS